MKRVGLAVLVCLSLIPSVGLAQNFAKDRAFCEGVRGGHAGQNGPSGMGYAACMSMRQSGYNLGSASDAKAMGDASTPQVAAPNADSLNQVEHVQLDASLIDDRDKCQAYGFQLGTESFATCMLMRERDREERSTRNELSVVRTFGTTRGVN